MQISLHEPRVLTLFVTLTLTPALTLIQVRMPWNTAAYRSNEKLKIGYYTFDGITEA